MADLPQDENNDTPPQTQRRRLSKDTLNLIIAVSAVLISAASFIATYMQSEAAFRQVKAETWPLLQFDHGNVDGETHEKVVYVTLENVGVGPANVKSFQLFYDGQPIRFYTDLLVACCAIDGDEDNEQLKTMSRHQLTVVSDRVSQVIIPSDGHRTLFSVRYRDGGEALWAQIDRARWKLSAKSCYCSLLDECFETDFKTDPVEVSYCPR